MKRALAFWQFKVEKAIYNELSRDEKKALPILIKASQEIAKIYLDQQKNFEKYSGASLYPHNVADVEIEKESKNNPQILSPYTIVQKKERGIIVIPYHEMFRDRLQKISALLKQAALIIRDQHLRNYLSVAATSLLDGNYDKMNEAMLKTENSTLQILLGPYQRLLDRRFFTKTAYTCFVGINDTYYTQRAERIKEILFATIREAPNRYTAPLSIQVASIHNITFSGFSADAFLSTEDFPQDKETIRKYGSKLVGYLSAMDYKFEKLLYPIFTKIFARSFRQSYSEELLRRANYYQMLIYGLVRQLDRYEGSRERLRELLPILREVNSVVSGIAYCKHLIMKGVIDQKELEAIIVMHICWCFSEWVFAKENPIRIDFLSGDAAALNFYFQQEALKEFNGIFWPNFGKIFFEIESLSSLFDSLLEKGSYGDVYNFLKKNLSYEIFKAFDSKLSKIKLES